MDEIVSSSALPERYESIERQAIDWLDKFAAVSDRFFSEDMSYKEMIDHARYSKQGQVLARLAVPYAREIIEVMSKDCAIEMNEGPAASF